MSSTPETDAYNGTHETHRIGGKTIYDHARSVEHQRNTALSYAETLRNQLSRICQEGFGNDDTIGLEPADDYVLRKLAELRAGQVYALELLREIRDNEVNAQDEADKFLRDHQPSQLAKWQALAEGLAAAIKNASTVLGTTPRQDLALAAYEAAKKGESGSEPQKCTWAEDSDGYWQTSCKQTIVFEYAPPFEQGCKFCHHCGKPLHFIKFTYDEEEE